VLPTASARALAPAAREFAQAAASFAQATSVLEEKPTGAVRIAAAAPVATHLLMPIIPGLIERYPELSINLEPDLSLTDLDGHAADLALRGSGVESGLPGGENLLARKLWSGPCVPVASKSYAAQLGTLDDLSDARWLTYGRQYAGLRWAKMVLDNVPPSRIVLRTDDTNTLIAAVSAGVGASWMSRLMCGDEIVEVRLSEQLSHLEGPDEELWIVTHRGLRHVPRVDAVWSFLIDRLGPAS
jgi:DNA-binding transcriptional LysR family regulator